MEMIAPSSAESPRGNFLARNMALNVAGGVIPAAMGMLTIPYILHHLGVDRFGILSLAWAAINYFTAFDVGLGRATLKYVAEALGQDRLEEIPAIVGTMLMWQFGFSVAGAALLGLGLPLLITSIVKVPAPLLFETREMFYILGASVPIVVGSLSLRRVVEAAQRFDLATAIRIPAQTSLFWAPAIAAFFGLRLPGIAVVLLVSQAVSLVAYGIAASYAIPILRSSIRVDRRMNRRLLSYGGWITVSTMITPAMAFLDRFLIGSLVSVAAVAFYAVPYEALMRINYLLPSCLAATLFPAFSALGDGRPAEAERLYVRSMKYMLVAASLIALVLILFAGDFLTLWLGADFARHSTVVFQLLAVGFLLSGMAWLPTTLLQSMGRPDLVSKLLLVEIAVYLVLAWAFIARWGIQGAAYAMVLRSVFEICVLFVAAVLAFSLRPRAFTDQRLLLGSAAALGLAIAALQIAPFFAGNRALQVGTTSAILFGFAFVAWLWVFNAADRKSLVDLVARPGALFGRPVGRA